MPKLTFDNENEQLPERIALYIKEQIGHKFFGVAMNSSTQSMIIATARQELRNLGYDHFVPEISADPVALNLGILILNFRKRQ